MDRPESGAALGLAATVKLVRFGVPENTTCSCIHSNHLKKTN